MEVPVLNADNPFYFLKGYFNNTAYSGSLWQALSDTDVIYPFAAADPGIKLNFSNTSVQFSLEDYGQNLWMAMPVITQLLSPNVTRGLVACTYPLSGQYDHLPRVLFYVAAIFAVMGRHRTWVAEAALGIIIAYSATAAVHLFVLLGLYRFRLPKEDSLPSYLDDAT